MTVQAPAQATPAPAPPAINPRTDVGAAYGVAIMLEREGLVPDGIWANLLHYFDAATVEAALESFPFRPSAH